MDSKTILNKEFSSQEFGKDHPYSTMLDKYREIAANYARMENVIAVLSDLRANRSYIYYGGFAQRVALESNGEEDSVSSIWEEDIFRLVHPDDLADKHLQELCFFNFVRRQPKKLRANYYLMSRLRMRSNTSGYIPVLHRMYHVCIPADGTLWLALCLYGPMTLDLPDKGVIINSVNGEMTTLDKHHNSKILSDREKQVLNLIDKGMTSKDIAATLFISKNTVSRHRQEILAKLQVKNSIEACRIAKDLGLMV